MKIIPIITAILVAAILGLLVLQRDRVLAFAKGPDTDITVVDPATPAPEVATRDHIVRVVALASTARNIDSAVILRGRTEAARQVNVSGETSGLIISEPIHKGAYVAQGDTLCELAPGTRIASLAEARARLAEARGRVPEAAAAIAEAQARLREANINVENARRLNERGVSSETQLISAEAASEAALAGLQRAQSGTASAQAGIEAASAGVAAAEAEIDRLTIHAPFSGLLETDTAELGTLMQPGASCATIVQLDPIKLVGFVPETDVAKVTVGAMTRATLATGAEITGQVTFLSRSADETTRTFRVEVEVPNADSKVSAGQTVEIVVASDGRNAHLIPQSSLTLNDEGALGVRTVAADSTALFMPVTMLTDTVDGVWVADLPDRVNIITIGQEFVIDGVTVEPTYTAVKG
ncbi:multidrug efflux system membrane fusion protein [Loktanella ponticola]|uniref:Multidrug efflux system membrane fusion protein n=1 Tax=Yoonia ponticola TaxID=1524255 RepID=A0A7W9EXW0_9RHOB|nr:efflux RND transporter periplasmic adaptor subunit [Yoonia ponticola]MBB5722122.1 multidrug efflux system membrane fusion protein [Yoonia ponticola]